MNDFSELINSSKPTLVDFFATWCGPCRMQSTLLEDVKKAVGDAATIIKVDVDANSSLSERYDVRSVPTLIIFKNGEAVWRASGVHAADTLINKLKAFGA